MSQTLTGWPLYFAKRPLKSRNLSVQVGEPFPYQDINVIRGYGPAYGVEDAFKRAVPDLDFVEVIDVHDRQMQRHVMQQGLTAKVVKKMLHEEAAA